MGTGFTALLDDIAAIAKVAMASLDDVATQAARASVKAVSVVIDDTAVTPSYALGLPAHRELPIVARIAAGSLRNKLLFLLPIALLLGLFAPWAISPLLMLGGTYLCYEGAEKVIHAMGHALGSTDYPAVEEGAGLSEDARVRSAVQTDFILSAEIMTITLGNLPDAAVWVRGLILGVVGVALTVLVYGAVAFLVKADDVGAMMAGNLQPFSDPLGRRTSRSLSRADRVLSPFTNALGRGLVAGMPIFLRGLGVVGTAAMIWVGGGIILHGFAEHGSGHLEHALDGLATSVGREMPPALAASVSWAVGAAGSGIFGLLVGGALVPVIDRVARPALRRVQESVRPRKLP